MKFRQKRVLVGWLVGKRRRARSQSEEKRKTRGKCSEKSVVDTSSSSRDGPVRLSSLASFVVEPQEVEDSNHRHRFFFLAAAVVSELKQKCVSDTSNFSRGGPERPCQRCRRSSRSSRRRTRFIAFHRRAGDNSRYISTCDGSALKTLRKEVFKRSTGDGSSSSIDGSSRRRSTGDSSSSSTDGS